MGIFDNGQVELILIGSKLDDPFAAEIHGVAAKALMWNGLYVDAREIAFETGIALNEVLGAET